MHASCVLEIAERDFRKAGYRVVASHLDLSLSLEPLCRPLPLGGATSEARSLFCRSALNESVP
jgi:hypothetical protein